MYANIPTLSLTCRAIFTETWPLNFNADAKVIFHVNHYDVGQVNSNFGVLRLLRALCDIKVTEERTVVVLHSFTAEEIDIQSEGFARRLDNLKSWIHRYFAGDTPLYNANLEIMHYDTRRVVRSTQVIGLARQKARYESLFLGLIRNFHLIRRGDSVLWKGLAIKFINDYDAADIPSLVRRLKRVDQHNSDERLEEEVIAAVVGLVEPKQLLPNNTRSWKEVEVGFATYDATFAIVERLLARAV